MRVVIESPYQGDIPRNLTYARRALKDSLNRGEFPLAGHLLYTQVLDDSVITERETGIRAHMTWLEVADAVIFYTDYGMSPGMTRAQKLARRRGKFIATRKIGLNP